MGQEQERFRGDVRKGTIVEFHPQGKRTAPETDTSGPLVGIVHRGSDGQLDLVVFNYRGQPELKKAVYHVSHPDLYDNFGNISGAGYRIGSWDWLKTDSPSALPVLPGCECNVDEKIESLSAAMAGAVDELARKNADTENGLGGAIDSLMTKMKELEAQVAALSKKPEKAAK